MCKKETKIKVIEKFKCEDIGKRKEILEKLLYNLIKNSEESCDIEIYSGSLNHTSEHVAKLSAR